MFCLAGVAGKEVDRGIDVTVFFLLYVLACAAKNKVSGFYTWK